ncbi:MAG: type III-A CRISPR-associated protein Cas10/Csm1 [Candidatus Helarchaeota archaeon]
MRNKRIILAGLFHDIGKFYQRIFSSKYRLVKHSKVGEEILTRLGFPGEIIELIKYHHEDDSVIQGKVNNIEMKNLIQLIKFSDHLSSAERGITKDMQFESKRPLKSIFSSIDVEKIKLKRQEEKVQKNKGKNEFRYIFYRQLYNDRKGESPFFYPIEQVGTNPTKLQIKNPNEIIEKFEDNLNIDKKSYLDNPNYILRILENWLFFLPARTTVEGSDISLADHVKTTAAIADAMYRAIGKEHSKVESFKKSDKKVFKLIKIAISGTQKFIIKVPEAKALRIMRAKSMFIDFILQDVSSYVLNKLNLSRVNLIYCSGGNAYILGYNKISELSSNDRSTNSEVFNIDEIQTLLDKYSYEFLGIDLKIYIDDVDLSPRDLEVQKVGDEFVLMIGKKFSEVSEKINRKKAFVYNSLLEGSDFLDDLVNSPKVCYTRDYIKCAICGKYGHIKEMENQLNIGEEETRICKNCNQIYIISKNLVRERHVHEDSYEKKPNNKNVIIILARYNYEWKQDEVQNKYFRGSIKFPFSKWAIFSVEKNQIKKLEEYLRSEFLQSVFVLNEFNPGIFSEILEIVSSKKGISDIFDFDYISQPNYVFSTDQHLLYEKDAIGNDKKAVLRMDVDNLGKIFVYGIPQDQQSLSRLATLSRLMEYFFKNIIPNIMTISFPDDFKNLYYISNLHLNNLNNFLPYNYFNEKMKKIGYKNERRIVLIYSSGDDVLLTGAWFDVLITAFEIYDLFRIYTCFNPSISLSAGYVMVPKKYPISFSSEITENLIDIAKSIDGKSSLCFFGEAANKWDVLREKINIFLNSILQESLDHDEKRMKISKNTLLKLIELIRNEKGSSHTKILSIIYYLFARQTGYLNKYSDDYFRLGKELITYTFSTEKNINLESMNPKRITLAIFHLIDQLTRSRSS